MLYKQQKYYKEIFHSTDTLVYGPKIKVGMGCLSMFGMLMSYRTIKILTKNLSESEG